MPKEKRTEPRGNRTNGEPNRMCNRKVHIYARTLISRFLNICNDACFMQKHNYQSLVITVISRAAYVWKNPKYGFMCGKAELWIYFRKRQNMDLKYPTCAYIYTVALVISHHITIINAEFHLSCRRPFIVIAKMRRDGWTILTRPN